jgi:hypothetical protein
MMFRLTGITIPLQNSEGSFPLPEVSQDLLVEFILNERLTSNRSRLLEFLPMLWSMSFSMYVRLLTVSIMTVFSLIFIGMKEIVNHFNTRLE